jgi:UDP-glucose 4-epimerase
MKVLVTGGAGFIGRHTVRRLLSEGAQVLVLDDFSSSVRNVLDEFAGHAGFEVITGDICDESQVRHAFMRWRPEAVVHLAGLVSVARSIAQPGESRRLNVDGTRIIAGAAEAAGCRLFVFASSAAVYADAQQLPLCEDDTLRVALSPYGAHKAEAERWLLATPTSGMQRIVMRYFNVYGEGQPMGSPYSGVITRFLSRIREGRGLQVYGDGSKSRDFVDIRDVAAVNAHAVAGKLAQGVYNVCSGSATTISTLVRLLQERFPGLEVVYLTQRSGEIQHSLGSY